MAACKLAVVIRGEVVDGVAQRYNMLYTHKNAKVNSSDLASSA
jgi:hypothetical protein